MSARSALSALLLAVFAILTLLPTIAAGDVPLIRAEPLAPRSAPRGATMFHLMAARETGVVAMNRYDDPKMWNEHYEEFALGSIGTGVAIGDYDHDGRPDLFVVCKTGQSRLFRNLGNWKFEDVTERAGLQLRFGDGGWVDTMKGWVGPDLPHGSAEQWQQGATFVDVNNDGWLDLYICRFNAPNLLYINQHDGTFREEAAARGLALVDASGMAAFCDYDRDGKLDVYVQTSLRDSAAHPNGSPGHLLHNNGDGTFAEVTGPAGIKFDTLAHSATWWDFDNDGWPDLYVANDFAGPDVLYHNNHDGTFTNVIDRSVPHMPYSSMGADLGDVNNDGRIDLFVADMAPTTHEKDYRGMARAREMNRDAETRPAPQYSRNALLLNSGTRSLREAAALAGIAATDWTWSVRFEDLDNDGRLDLYVTNGMTREFQNEDLIEMLIETESPEIRHRLIRSQRAMSERHLAFRNLGDLRFEDVSHAWGLDQIGVGFGAALGDLDGDGDLDLAYSSYESNVTLLRNDSDRGHRLIVALRGTQSNRFGIGATVRIQTAAGPQVRQLVLARGYLSSSEPMLHFGLGEERVVQRLTVEWPSGITQTFENLPADQRYTLTEAAPAAAPEASLAPRVQPQFVDVTAAMNLGFMSDEEHVESSQPLLTFRLNRRGPALAVGDLTGRGESEMIVGGTAVNPGRILTPGPGGRYTATSLPALTNSGDVPDGPILIFDADGDGTNDLLVTKAGTRGGGPPQMYQPKLWLNDGHGALRLAPDDAMPALAMRAGAAAAADFNRDGLLDVFIGGRVQPGEYPLAPRSALLANRGGRFEDVTDSLAPGLREVGMVTSALWSDVDGDGWVDLMLTLDWGTVKYFHNDAGHGFTDWSERAGFAAAGTGWWTSLASTDFNQDGRPDFVAGNVGLNTPFTATPTHPTLLFYGSFGRTKGPIILEAYYQGDRLYPRRTRHDLGREIPSIRHRFKCNNDYARATLEEVVSASDLAQAKRFAATQFASGVFLSQPDGTYRFSPLPRIAQIAPLQGIVAADLDGDGHADIYAVQNLYATPAVGRFDGGLSQFLRGDGAGHFDAIDPATCGLIVPGNAKALATVDFDHDGWPDFLLTRNSSTTMAFRNTGLAGRHSFSVALRGRGSNRSAIGARVTVELQDGTRQTEEMTVGSSYYSQNPAALFFGFADGNPPRALSVRWPDGHASTQSLGSVPPHLLIDEPTP